MAPGQLVLVRPKQTQPKPTSTPIHNRWTRGKVKKNFGKSSKTRHNEWEMWTSSIWDLLASLILSWKSLDKTDTTHCNPSQPINDRFDEKGAPWPSFTLQALRWILRITTTTTRRRSSSRNNAVLQSLYLGSPLSQVHQEDHSCSDNPDRPTDRLTRACLRLSDELARTRVYGSPGWYSCQVRIGNFPGYC